jgi:hypothetical protein
VGIEPTTFGLKGRCSTSELRPSNRSGHLSSKKSRLAGVARLAAHEPDLPKPSQGNNVRESLMRLELELMGA